MSIVTKFCKGIFDIRAEEYVKSGVPFVRISNLRDGIIDEDDLAYITEEYNEKESKTCLYRNDIILSKTAYPAASLVQFEKCNCSQDTIAVSTNRSADFNKYLVVYLNSRFGLQQLERLFQGNIQRHLSLPDTRTFTIPVPSEDFQVMISSLFEEMIRRKQEAKALYLSAQSLLLENIGLSSIDLSHQVAYTAHFNHTVGAHRLDAEYFQPKYQRVLDVLRKPGIKIHDVAELVKTRFTPSQQVPFQYIEIGDIAGDGFTEHTSLMGEEAPSRAQWIVQPGDVITSTVRPIRRLSALIEDDQRGFVCSSGFAVLRPRNIAPELLLAYLRLPIFCEILDLFTTASMYPAISTTDLLQIPFALPGDEDVCQEVVSLVQQSRRARHEAKRLIEFAKHQVESLIQESGQAALEI
jgi:restriction endonuclease S subunit